MTFVSLTWSLVGERRVKETTLRVAQGSERSDGPALAQRHDDELMLLCKEGHRAAFGVVVARYEGRIFGYACRYLGDRSLAEDACQETFLTLWRLRERYRPEGKLTAYLSRLCLNACRDAARRRRRRTAATDRLASKSKNDHDVAPGEEDAFFATERSKQLERVISRLPAKHREALLLRFFNDLSYEEMAAVLKKPEATLRSRVFHGLKQLRKCIGEGEL